MTTQKAVFCLIVLAGLAHISLAAPPYGFLDAAAEGIAAGWARDDDFSGPVQVEIYIDGNLIMTGPANLFRPDVGSHAYDFQLNTFGPGLHTTNAYALGVNPAGQPDGDRVELNNSPKTWTGAPSPPVLQVDGQPFFMMGWYTSYASSSVPESEQYLSTMRHQGMNTALICYGVWTYNPYMTNQLEGAITSNMKIMVEVNRWAVQELEGYPLSVIDDQVDLLKNYSSMLGWYLIDEPEVEVPVVTPAMAQARYNQIKTRDPAHAITVAHVGYNSNYPDPYLAAEPPPYCDVEMTDTYPILDGYTEFAAPLWIVATESRLRTIQTATHGKEAFINIVQAHGDFGLRIPTYIENRYLNYAPIVQGARGLLYWMHNAYTTAGHQAQVVPPVAHEIQSLVPAIISNSTAVVVSSNKDSDTTGHGIKDISYLFGQDERCGYLIETNNTPSTYAVQFQLTGSILAVTLGAGQTTIPVMFEQRSITAQSTGNPNVWTLADSISPFGVHVYRLYEIAAPPAAAVLPGKASKPNPENASIAVGRTFDLHWAPGTDATSYQVYFGTDNPPPSQVQQTSTSFNPGQMGFNTTYYWRIDSINNQGTTTGDLWSLTTRSPNPPGQVTNPVPLPAATNIDLFTSVNWKWGASARTYNVYFGTTNPPPFQQSTASFTNAIANLAYCTTYYWRIDPVNDDGATTGQVWSFTTKNPSTSPDQPSNPSPPHQAVDVRINTHLSWTGANTTQYSVYFGTINPPSFRVAQAGNTCDPGTLLSRTTYYWRVDASNACVTTTGQLWSFTTGWLKGDLDGDDDSDQTDFGLFQRCFSGSGVPYPPGCTGSDLTGDGDVDQEDAAAFFPCMAGPNHLPGC